MNKRRLSKRNLKKIPMKKYRLGDEPDTCAICLESFIPGEKLRHLPCKHGELNFWAIAYDIFQFSIAIA